MLQIYNHSGKHIIQVSCFSNIIVTVDKSNALLIKVLYQQYGITSTVHTGTQIQWLK